MYEFYPSLSRAVSSSLIVSIHIRKLEGFNSTLK